MSLATLSQPSTLLQSMRQIIAADGPLSVARYMAACLYDPEHGYYATRADIGRTGDFITAPEVSQMFGEVLGLMCADIWVKMGRPNPVQLIELGPGRGLLMADIVRVARVMPDFAAALRVTLVDISPSLRRAQAETLSGQVRALMWADRLRDADDGPCIILGNEFLDCLPVRQFVRMARGWQERVVALGPDGSLIYALSPQTLSGISAIPPRLRDSPEGTLVEVRPQAEAVLADIAGRLKRHTGVAVFIDYGPAQSEAGDTVQALVGHQKVDPLHHPGFADITARVDFEALIAAGTEAGLYAHGPVTQGRLLKTLGIDIRAERLMRAAPDKAPVIVRAKERLCADDQMGRLFKAVAFSSSDLITLPGF